MQRYWFRSIHNTSHGQKMEKEDIIRIGETIKSKNVKLFGGKSSAVIKMATEGIEVVNGIALSTKIFEQFMTHNHLYTKLRTNLFSDSGAEHSENNIQTLFKMSQFPKQAADRITNMLKDEFKSCRLIVRSSANVEDSKKYSFAGQFETKLDVMPSQVLDAIKEVYSSLYRRRSLEYVKAGALDLKGIKTGILIQQFINTDFAGVIFTANPVSGDRNEIIFEYVKGLGEYLVNGKKEPSSMTFNKQDISPETVSKRMPSQPHGRINHQLVSKVLSRSIYLEKLFGTPVDVEWGIKNNDLFIFQCRPITTLQYLPKKSKTHKEFIGYSQLNGIPSSPGIARGSVRVVNNSKNLSHLKIGEILVSEITSIDYMPDMLRAAGVVTELGGVTSHAAIVTREHAIPCVTGVRGALLHLKTGMHVAVDGNNGIIYFKGKKVPIKELPDGATDMIIEGLKPYKATLKYGTVYVGKSKKDVLFRNPANHFVIQNFDEVIVIYRPLELQAYDDTLIDLIGADFKKPAIIGNPDRYDCFVNFGYACSKSKEFSTYFNEMKHIIINANKLDLFALNMMNKSRISLDEAESILSGGLTDMNRIAVFLKKVNDSALYFSMINWPLTMGYGIKYLREKFKVVDEFLNMDFNKFMLIVDDKNQTEILKSLLKNNEYMHRVLSNIIDVYEIIKKWKDKSDMLDQEKRRSRLWNIGAKEFKKLTGANISELIKGQHFSGYAFDTFVDNFNNSR